MEIGIFAEADMASAFSFGIALPSLDLQRQWGRCNLLANYVAEYVAYQFPQREWAENLISTVTNEFLEAIALLAPPQSELFIRCFQLPTTLELELEHSLRPDLVTVYTSFLAELAGSLDEADYFALLTSTDRPAVAFNQFGLAMLVHDFSARIAARLDPQTRRICVRVSLPTGEIAA
ncbi:MAG: hypothetical protein EI684_21650 [Candidatus Viridilinea halotolerans]|uniref:Uncharacterized protein n=1 Tax=Candidatus Viridilinea halotolerans TaxID=2491704 RepID=A0A426TRA7_9CHLR|nr:MAG: hypothetical protein EI684_21650 [Candidatus Viridilinea halotolerans]